MGGNISMGGICSCGLSALGGGYWGWGDIVRVVVTAGVRQDPGGEGCMG